MKNKTQNKNKTKKRNILILTKPVYVLMWTDGGERNIPERIKGKDMVTLVHAHKNTHMYIHIYAHTYLYIHIYTPLTHRYIFVCVSGERERQTESEGDGERGGKERKPSN